VPLIEYKVVPMAEIFASENRTRTEPKKPGEGDFSFYDSSARPEYEIYRGLVNGWLHQMPEAEHAEMAKRSQPAPTYNTKPRWQS
jgi:hypothetical protein